MVQQEESKATNGENPDPEVAVKGSGADWSKWIAELRQMRLEAPGKCKFCLLTGLHELLDGALKAGEYETGIKAIQWLLQVMYPESFGSPTPAGRPHGGFEAPAGVWEGQTP